MALTRRDLLIASSAGGALVAAGALGPARAGTSDDDVEAVERLIGRTTTPSDRIELVLPASFPTGSTVPLSLALDTAMTDADHLTSVRLFAPRNPIVEIVGFRFEPGLSVPRVSTRIRLAKPQHVVAVAEMNDGALLSAARFVDVATDGCA